MKTLFEINKMISDSRKITDPLEFRNEKLITKTEKKELKLLAFYRKIKSYLECNPSEVFVYQEIFRVERAIRLIEAGFEEWKKNVYSREGHGDNPRTAYRKESGQKKFEDQLKTLYFILN